MSNIMLRQLSSRNSRSKGSNQKKALQICVLLGITVWLIYQLKHSSGSGKAGGGDEPHSAIKLGRKDLPPAAVAEAGDDLMSERTDDEESEEIEELMKQFDSEGDDDMDEPEHYRDEDDAAEDDEDDDGGVSLLAEEDEEKKLQGDSVKEVEKSNAGDQGQSASSSDAVSSEEAHGTAKNSRQENSHEAREKSFRGDDASSAVAAQGTHEQESTIAAGGEEERGAAGEGSTGASAAAGLSTAEPSRNFQQELTVPAADATGNRSELPASLDHHPELSSPGQHSQQQQQLGHPTIGTVNPNSALSDQHVISGEPADKDSDTNAAANHAPPAILNTKIVEPTDGAVANG